jgi:hypothetical protein
MECREGKLCEFEGGIGEDGFVCEDLNNLLIDTISKVTEVTPTIPIVANVLTTIQIAAVLVLLSGAAG